MNSVPWGGSAAFSDEMQTVVSPISRAGILFGLVSHFLGIFFSKPSRRQWAWDPNRRVRFVFHEILRVQSCR
jgi:hypothetical protein